VPNIRSAKKRVKVIETKTLRNKSYTSATRTAVKKANTALEAKSADREALARAAMKKLDQAVTKGVLHKNTAARRKSAIAAKLRSAQ